MQTPTPTGSRSPSRIGTPPASIVHAQPAGHDGSARARPTRDVAAPRGRSLRRTLAALWLVAAATALLPGLPYYRMDRETRVYSDLHRVYAPTGAVGHALGYAGTALIITGVAMYAARKRLPLLQGVGLLPTWLSVHIFMCSMGAYLVLLHTSMRVRGLAAVAFWAMLVAVASGIVGRYLYVRIPRARDGRERTLADVRARVAELALAGGPSDDPGGRAPPFVEPVLAADSGIRALLTLPLADIRRITALRRASRTLAHLDRKRRRELLALLDERLRLEQQIATLRPVQRVLRYWHVLHIPIALVMFVALALHITIAVLFGYGWPF